MTRAVYAPATLVGVADGAVTFSLPNVAHREKCEQHREAVEAAIRNATGATVVVQLLVEGEPTATPTTAPPTPAAEPAPNSVEPTASPEAARPVPAASSAPAAPSPIDDPPDDDDVDLDDLVDAPPESVKSPIDRLAEAFPGSELIDERT
jgi:DNA polymerase-3 subunit gamma/tau